MSLSIKLLDIALCLSIPLKVSSATLFTSLLAITYEAVAAQVAERMPIAVAIAIGPEITNLLFLVTALW